MESSTELHDETLNNIKKQLVYTKKKYQKFKTLEKMLKKHNISYGIDNSRRLREYWYNRYREQKNEYENYKEFRQMILNLT